MLRYLFKRFLSGTLVLFLFASGLFFAVNLVLPGDFVSHFALAMEPAEMAALRRQLGLDLPLWQRYLQWLGQIIRLDLGRSYTGFGSGPMVVDIIKGVLPSTLLVFGLGTFLAFILGEWLGRLVGWKKPDFFTGSITFSAIALYTSFPPWLAFLLVYFIGRRSSWLQLDFNRRFWRTAAFPPTTVMNYMVLGLVGSGLLVLVLSALYRRARRRTLPLPLGLALLAAFWVAIWWLIGIPALAIEVLKVAALPLLAYVLLSFGEIMLVMRTSMVDTLHEEYLTTARAKGLPDAQIRDRHAARNAIIPVISRLVITLPYLLTGMVMIEMALGWGAMGSTLFYAVGQQNVPLGLGMGLLIGVISLAARLVLDVLQVLIDPRLRSQPLDLRRVE